MNKEPETNKPETAAVPAVSEEKPIVITEEIPEAPEGSDSLTPLDSVEHGEFIDENKTSKAPLIIFLCLILLIGAAYGAGTYYYKNHFFFNTCANGKSLKNLTVAEAEKLFTQDYDSLKITLKEKEREEIIHLEDMNAKISVGDQIKKLRASENPYLWFLNVWGTNDHTVSLDVSYDDAALAATVDALECFKAENVQAPVNAYIQAGQTQFEIVPEVLGNTVKKDELIAAIGEAASTCVTSVNLEEKDLYELPEYYSTDQTVTDALAKANKYGSANITYDFSYTTENVSYAQIKDWVKISKKFKVKLDKTGVEDYVYGLAKKYNTMGAAKKFTTTAGNVINIADGDYGWKIYHDKETTALMKNIKAGETVTREPEYSYRALVRNSADDDIGKSYVEVSISAQEVWLYIDGECKVDTSCVTGDPTKHHDTTKGIYALTFKKSPATLTGPNSNGTTYSSDVTYWMPFNGNQGLHDATWRDSFGGKIYKGNGSHGCVNLPFSAAETIYGYIYEGFPVIVY